MPSLSPSALPEILVAEDDPNDLELLKNALAGAAIRNPVVTFGNGMEAIEFLKRICVVEAAAPRARLLLLDLHLPQIDGHSVIAWARKQPALSRLRIVVLSGSDDTREVKSAAALGADLLWHKPATSAALAAEVARLQGVAVPTPRLPAKLAS